MWAGRWARLPGPSPGGPDRIPRPGRLAQLGEHQLDKLGVTGSSPVAPIQTPASKRRPAWMLWSCVSEVPGMLVPCVRRCVPRVSRGPAPFLYPGSSTRTVYPPSCSSRRPADAASLPRLADASTPGGYHDRRPRRLEGLREGGFGGPVQSRALTSPGGSRAALVVAAGAPGSRHRGDVASLLGDEHATRAPSALQPRDTPLDVHLGSLPGS